MEGFQCYQEGPGEPLKNFKQKSDIIIFVFQKDYFDCNNLVYIA